MNKIPINREGELSNKHKQFEAGLETEGLDGYP